MNDKTAPIEFLVWHIPQIPMKAFEVPCGSYEEAAKIRDVLANYDLFQFENKVKPDYCNMSGIQWKSETIGDGDWEDLDDDEDDRRMAAEDYGIPLELFGLRD